MTSVRAAEHNMVVGKVGQRPYLAKGANNNPAEVKNLQTHLKMQLTNMAQNASNRGDRAEAQRLIKMARALEVDGKFGSQTEAAVKEVQTHYKASNPKMLVDGQVGAQTWTAIYSFGGESATPGKKGLATGAGTNPADFQPGYDPTDTYTPPRGPKFE